MNKSLKLLAAALVVAQGGNADAFVVSPEAKPAMTELNASRRGFMVASFGASLGFLASGNSPALAIDDLAMPSEEEEQARQVSDSIL